jgi:2-oxoglutarate-dependent dioxygenase
MSLSIVTRKKWLEDFWRDGYAKLGPVLTAEELADYRSRYQALFFGPEGRTQPEVRDLSEKRGSAPQFAMMQRINLWAADSAFAAFVRRDDILKVAGSILGPKIRLFRDQGFYKPPCSGEEVYMHQDNRYWHLNPPNAVTLWISLDDATTANGCMHYVRGSHHWGPVKHIRAAHGESILLEALVDRHTAYPVEMPAGHCTVHHCLTVHYTPSNRTRCPRRAYTIQYMAADVSMSGTPTSDHPLFELTPPAEGEES